jgi:hypothetical protein
MSTTNVGRLPLGVAILAVLIGVFGFFVLALGLLIVFVGVGVGLAGGASVFGLTGVVAGLIVLILGAVILGAAVGLWDQELWALVLTILALLFLGVVEYLTAAWLALVVIIVLVVYLAAVSSHFD